MHRGASSRLLIGLHPLTSAKCTKNGNNIGLFLVELVWIYVVSGESDHKQRTATNVILRNLRAN